MKILLIGFGFVGKATYLLNNKTIETYVYDIDKNLCIPKDIVLNDILEKVDLVFISLPTPTNIDGSCYTGLINDLLNNIHHEFIIIRSTIPIGYCDSKKVFFMPEFLTEQNWKYDFINNKHWLFGIYDGCNDNKSLEFKNKINKLFNTAYDNKCINFNNISFGKNKEMELTKLIRNTFLSTKIAYFNEIYDLTQKLNIDYNTVIEFVKYDERIGNSHMLCPGHDAKRGYGGTCFPKDTLSLYNQLIQNNINSFILQSSLDRNENHDRPERDWLKDINRTNIKDNQYKIILIAGGAGFLGRHLCKKLLENSNNKIICMDNLITGNINNIEEFINNKNFKFINFNINNKIFLPHVDQIYNLACIASPDKYKIYSIETLETCFIGTTNLLQLAKKHNAKFLFTSTSEIYGDPLVHPQPEEYYGNVNTVGERSCYDEGKRVCETLIYEYRKKFNLDLKIVRLFNTYGPYMDINDGRVITNFIKQIKNNENLKIYGNGNQTRSFCYISDIINGLVSMMNSSESGPINLGNPNCEFTLNELVKIFEKIMGKKLNIDYIDSMQDDPQQRKPVIDKAKSLLNFNPVIDIEEGLLLTMKYFL